MVKGAIQSINVRMIQEITVMKPFTYTPIKKFKFILSQQALKNFDKFTHTNAQDTLPI